MSSPLYQLMKKYNINLEHSSWYYPQANGLTEAFNKTLCKIIKKMVARHKKDWHEWLPEALWVYCPTFHTPTQAIPYSLVFSTEAVLPVKIQVPSLRIVIQDGLIEVEATKICLSELEALDESRLATQQHLELYQARMALPYNKKVKLHSFTKGELVRLARSPLDLTRRKKVNLPLNGTVHTPLKRPTLMAHTCFGTRKVIKSSPLPMSDSWRNTILRPAHNGFKGTTLVWSCHLQVRRQSRFLPVLDATTYTSKKKSLSFSLKTNNGYKMQKIGKP